jgi:hypothetical protein
MHGFSVEMLATRVLAKLAIAVTEPMMAHRGMKQVVERIHITDIGRCHLKGRPPLPGHSGSAG